MKDNFIRRWLKNYLFVIKYAELFRWWVENGAVCSKNGIYR
jgi:hypothetical protein